MLVNYENKKKYKISLQYDAADKIILHECKYLVGDLDEQDKDDEYEQVVKDADSSDDDVDDFKCEIADVGQIQRQVVIFPRGCRDVIPDVTRQRCVLHDNPVH